MSAKATGEVWEFDLPVNEMMICLAMADHADHNGKNIYPSIALLAWKTGYSTRQVGRLINRLIAKRAVRRVTSGQRKGKPSTYAICFDTAPRKKPFHDPTEPEPAQPSEGVGHSYVAPADESAGGSDIAMSHPGTTSGCPTGSDTQMSDRTVIKPSEQPDLSADGAGTEVDDGKKTPPRKCPGPQNENLLAVSHVIAGADVPAAPRYAKIATWLSGGTQRVGGETVAGLDPFATPEEIADFADWYREEKYDEDQPMIRKLELWMEYFPEYRADQRWQQKRARRAAHKAKVESATPTYTEVDRMLDMVRAQTPRENGKETR